MKITITGIRELKWFLRGARAKIGRAAAFYVNGQLFDLRTSMMNSLRSKMTIRAESFMRGNLPYQKAPYAGLGIYRIAIQDVTERTRFTGWLEQETGAKTKRKHVIQPAARPGGNNKRRVSVANKLMSGVEIEDKHSLGAPNFVAMMRMLQRRSWRKTFILHKKDHSKYPAGLYRFAGKAGGLRKLRLLQKINGKNVQPQKNLWFTSAVNTFWAAESPQTRFNAALVKIFGR
jgi:hypothetical protein